MRAFDELLSLVDEQTLLLQQKACVLERMAHCVQEGRSEGLESLLTEEADFRAESDEMDRRRDDLRERIAQELGMAWAEVTLGRLVETLAGPASLALAERRERLIAAVGLLQDRARMTAHLVAGAIEFNQRLLNALSGADHGTSTYSPGGEVAGAAQGATFEQSV